MTTPLPCPFCGYEPIVGPLDPEEEGNDWAQVECANPQCPVNPVVNDGMEIADEEINYHEEALKRWNTRVGFPTPISVNKKLPTEDQCVLAYGRDDSRPPEWYRAYYWERYQEWRIDCSEYTLNHVTHWMSLPPPPK